MDRLVRREGPQIYCTIELSSDQLLSTMYYNYFRIHYRLRVIPAMVAAFTNYVRELEQLSALMETRGLAAIEGGAIKRRVKKREFD